MTHKGATLPSAMVKRSVNIAGNNTSVTLEDAFWTAVREIAAIQEISIEELVSRIDKDRQNNNRSSTIRVFATSMDR